jgi:DNA polymerase-3 subunit delta
MAKLDARRVGAFLDDPSPECRVVLLHGDDAGLIRDRASRLIARATGGDPLLLALVPREMAKHANSLAREAAAKTLFGIGRRVVWVQDATDTCAEAAGQALREGGSGLVILESSGEARSVQKLRRLLESAPAPSGQVIACYRERAEALARAIRRALGDVGLEADAAAMDCLSNRLSEDHLQRRSEIHKLAQYLGAGSTATLRDVLACIAEGSAVSSEDAAAAAFGGHPILCDQAIEAAIEEGADPIQVVRSAMRHLRRLELAAASIASGLTIREAVDAVRPPVLFWQRPALERTLETWDLTMVEAAGRLLLAAERDIKARGATGIAIARRALRDVTQLATRPTDVSAS